MLQCFLRAQSFLWFADELFDQTFGLPADFIPLLSVEVKLSLLYHLQDFLIVVAIKGWIAAQQDVQDASSTPEVALDTVVSRQDFWRYVVWRASTSAHLFDVLLVSPGLVLRAESPLLSELLRLYDLTQAEVNDLDV